MARMPAPSTTTLTVIALLPLLVWRMHARVRRLVGRQRIGRIRPWITLILFPLILGLLSLAAFAPPHPQPHKLAWLALGLAAGAALSLYGLRRTDFEATREGLFYTPHAPLGVVLSVLFIARIAWRIGELLIVGPVQNAEFTMSPWTLAPVGMFAGYFMGYSAGLIRWRLRYFAQKKARAAQ